MRLSHENILCHTASFCFAANPSASVHDISADIIRKKRGLLFRRLALPISLRTSNAEAHADMYSSSSPYMVIGEKRIY